MNTEIIVYVGIAAALVIITHLLSAIKSGCFYAAKRRDENNPLKPYIDNLHRVQTPFWYSLFGSLFFMLLAIYRLLHPQDDNWGIIKGIGACFSASYAASAFCGTFYQGAINQGSGLPYIDPNEKSKFEFIIGNFSVWIPKFWHGKNRVWISVLGFIFLILSLAYILS